MGYGIRVVLVMNRKGGSGKSTLCRALASVAAVRGETVTIFDTDASKSCLKWMQAGKAAGTRIAKCRRYDCVRWGCKERSLEKLMPLPGWIRSDAL